MDIQFSRYGMGGNYKLNTKGGIQYVGKDPLGHFLKNNPDFSPNNIRYDNETPTKEIDFKYKNKDELLEKISKRYDMKKMKPWDLCQVLSLLKQGGVISNDEYWLGQSIIPVNDLTSNKPRPEEFENALEDYYSNFETYVENNAHRYPPRQAQRLHDSMLVHKKIESIFKQIQSYR